MVAPTRELLEKHGIRCTRQRVELYEALAACKSHPTAEQLHRMVVEHSPGTSLATVYNTLETFTQSGLCRRITSAGPGGARFDADLSNHMHVVDREGRVMDVPEHVGQELLSAITPDVVERLERALGVSIEHIDVQVRTR
ncbi:MAG: Fur family transcriptional regulator [Phycisphaerales bacterium]